MKKDRFIYFLKPACKKRRAICIIKTFLLACVFLYSQNAFAWVYPEHRQIALLAIKNLSPEFRKELEKLWSEGRMGFEKRLTTFVIDTAQGRKPTQLDFAAWTAISGDHSCSPENLLYNVLETNWILNVADIAAALKIDIENAKSPSQHINALRNSDIRFQRADPDYATRAGSNNVHFLLSRPEANTTLINYLIACFSKGAPLNALGAYGFFHMSALVKASRYASEHLSATEKSALILSALADEAFALHFLEDVYAAGHIAGTWGNASLRKGTHDYYNERGLEVVSWNGKRTINMGDAYMKDRDAEIASAAVGHSLQQLLNAASGKLKLNIENGAEEHVSKPDSFNVCKYNSMPVRNYDVLLLGEIVVNTPVPGLATGLGELPRFRAELGPFWGISSSINGAVLFGGFGKEQTDHGGQGGIEANVRFGYGLDGVLNQAGDGLIFLQVGWRHDVSSTNKFVNSDPSIIANSFTSAIPGRSAYNLRLRMPFYLIPGDLLIAGPLLLLTSPKTLQSMAVTAANGGLLPWQSGIATGIGRFQFVLGREVGVSFYGLNNTKDILIVPTIDTTFFVQYKSTKLDFPIIEYRPLRSFSQSQSASLMVQLNAGVDIPSHIEVISPTGKPTPPLKNSFYVGIRVLFNWRSYY